MRESSAYDESRARGVWFASFPHSATDGEQAILQCDIITKKRAACQQAGTWCGGKLAKTTFDLGIRWLMKRSERHIAIIAGCYGVKVGLIRSSSRLPVAKP